MAGFHDTDGRSAEAESVQCRDRESAAEPSPTAAITDAPHVTDAVFVRKAADDCEDVRPHVHVLMAVQVRHAKIRRQHALDLRAQFALDCSDVFLPEQKS